MDPDGGENDHAKRHRKRLVHRDHGHERMICNSYLLGRDKSRPGASLSYVWETGQLFLKTKEALDLRTPLAVRGYSSPDTAPALPAVR